MKPTISLGYADFWPGFNPETDFFTRLLRWRFDIRLSGRPDFLLYSAFGREHLRHRCVRIFYSGEAVRPDFRDCDYAFTFDYLDRPEHCRLPYYVRRLEGDDLVKRGVDARAALARKTRFCTFVYTDPQGVRRNRFFKRLSRYKRVDSGGGYLNNLGRRVEDKLAFLREGKFTIAFEHSLHPGYTTEKLTDAMRASTLPIYWGNPLVGREFNTHSFLNAHEFRSEEALIERIMELDRDDEQYAGVLGRPWLPAGRGNIYLDENRLLDQFDRIFRTPIVPVAQRRRRLALWDGRVRPFSRRAWNCLARRPRRWYKSLRGY